MLPCHHHSLAISTLHTHMHSRRHHHLPPPSLLPLPFPSPCPYLLPIPPVYTFFIITIYHYIITYLPAACTHSPTLLFACLCLYLAFLLCLAFAFLPFCMPLTSCGRLGDGTGPPSLPPYLPTCLPFPFCTHHTPFLGDRNKTGFGLAGTCNLHLGSPLSWILLWSCLLS